MTCWLVYALVYDLLASVCDLLASVCPIVYDLLASVCLAFSLYHHHTAKASVCSLTGPGSERETGINCTENRDKHN